MSMIKTWRWYGEHDNVSFDDIKQAGVSHIVTSLHHIPYGEVWPVKDILERKQLLEKNDLVWYVTESIPVHEDIKTRTGNFEQHIENYKQSIKNLGDAGVSIVCYNFMPVMDWTRTDIGFKLSSGARTLKFDYIAFVAFDVFILKRQNAAVDYAAEIIDKARAHFENLEPKDIEALTQVLIANLPGTDEKYSISGFNAALAKYNNINGSQLKQHLIDFLKEIIPVAEQAGVKMCIHPDDPPFSLLGLPRVVSTEKDIADLFRAVDSNNNGLTFCTGSFGVRKDNDLPKMFKRFADKVHFIHLRSTLSDAEGNFHEANHLQGDVDMYAVVSEIIKEQSRRKKVGRVDHDIPMRPDHGHQMMGDLQKKFYPGYSCIGRMKGLAELTGLEYGIEKSLKIS